MSIFEVNYLTILDQKDSFCITVSSFNHLLHTIDGLSIDKNRLVFRKLSVDYEVQTGEIPSGGQRFFHIKLLCNQEDRVDEFEDLLRSIRTILSKASGGPIQILWDGISLFYAQKAYPLIYEIENIMRKLITKFMLINIGLGWADEVVPKEVNESIRNRPQKSTHNYLYEVDFIQLSNFLLKEYTKANASTLLDMIRKANNIEDLNLIDLKEYIPKSNWARYFSSLVDCDSEFLRNRWEKLYERRNQVAHNKAISKNEFDEIVTLINDLKPKLEKALNSLDSINVSEEEREIVAEAIAGDKSARYEIFFNIWGRIEYLILELALLVQEGKEQKQIILQRRRNIEDLLSNLTKNKQIISSDLSSEVLALFGFKHVIIHNRDFIITEEIIQKYIKSAETCLAGLSEILVDLQIKKSQKSSYKEMALLEGDTDNILKDSLKIDVEDNLSNRL